jgi:hypothetical protein
MQEMLKSIMSLTELLPLFIELACAIVALASAVAAISPTPKQGHWFGRLYRVLDAFALNVGYAKDKPRRIKGGRFVAH